MMALAQSLARQREMAIAPGSDAGNPDNCSVIRPPVFCDGGAASCRQTQ
jgi:hypothetical protein